MKYRSNVVVEDTGQRSSSGHIYYGCLCECGRTYTIQKRRFHEDTVCSKCARYQAAQKRKEIFRKGKEAIIEVQNLRLEIERLKGINNGN